MPSPSSNAAAAVTGMAVLACLLAMAAAPPSRPALIGAEEIDGVFPQIGTGTVELDDENVVRALENAVKVADTDHSGGLTFDEVQPIFARIRAKGDPVWTRLDMQKFGQFFGDSKHGAGESTFAKIFSVIKFSNLELDWRAPRPTRKQHELIIHDED
jgi:hypothetical protein